MPTADHFPLEPLLTPREVAEYLHTSQARLAQDRYTGRGVPFLRHGRNVLYRASDIKCYLDAHRFERTGA